MAHASDLSLLTLHALKLKGFADVPVLASATAVDADQVERRLAELAEGGLVRRRTGPMPGWSLTAAGQRAHSELLRKDLEASEARPLVVDAYRRFMGINQELLQTCTAWQLRPSGAERGINDHSDAEYDRSVIERLAKLHETAAPVCSDLSAGLERYRTYGPRLEGALGRVRRGETDWFTRPVIDSYHTVWFELHEDLLLTLDIERAKEHVV